VLDLRGSSNVEIGCLEITDHSDCVEFHVDPALRCQRDRAPFGRWAAAGIAAANSHDVWLHDLDIHGLAGRGLLAGGLRDWTVERVKILGNGWAGWDGDIGAASSNSGAIVLRNVEVGWNGCSQAWPTRRTQGCWAQEAGGYGDGLGTAKTGGRWLIEDSRFHHNTSDGLDLLYLDGKPGSSVTLRRVFANANAGNQIKTRGAAVIEDSVVVGNCFYFDRRDAMTDGDQCRALGNALSIGLVPAQPVLIRHNTITGEGDCLILTGGGDATTRVVVQDNVLVGQLDRRANRQGNPGELTCGHYADNSRAQVAFEGNVFWNLKGHTCPFGNRCLGNPELTDMGLANFDATPLPGSPVIDHASHGDRQGLDVFRHPRVQGAAADIGAVETAPAARR
jgi:Right handed beta helix region